MLDDIAALRGRRSFGNGGDTWITLVGCEHTVNLLRPLPNGVEAPSVRRITRRRGQPGITVPRKFSEHCQNLVAIGSLGTGRCEAVRNPLTERSHDRDDPVRTIGGDIQERGWRRQRRSCQRGPWRRQRRSCQRGPWRWQRLISHRYSCRSRCLSWTRYRNRTVSARASRCLVGVGRERESRTRSRERRVHSCRGGPTWPHLLNGTPTPAASLGTRPETASDTPPCSAPRSEQQGPGQDRTSPAASVDCATPVSEDAVTTLCVRARRSLSQEPRELPKETTGAPTP